MSTSCVVRFADEEGPVCAFYKHYDGHTFFNELRDFTGTFTIVEGLSLDTERNVANGIDDLAAQVIAFFKEGPGDIYMCRVDDTGDYTYEVSQLKNRIVVTIV